VRLEGRPARRWTARAGRDSEPPWRSPEALLEPEPEQAAKPGAQGPLPVRAPAQSQEQRARRRARPAAPRDGPRAAAEPPPAQEEREPDRHWERAAPGPQVSQAGASAGRRIPGPPPSRARPCRRTAAAGRPGRSARPSRRSAPLRSNRPCAPRWSRDEAASRCIRPPYGSRASFRPSARFLRTRQAPRQARVRSCPVLRRRRCRDAAPQRTGRLPGGRGGGRHRRPATSRPERRRVEQAPRGRPRRRLDDASAAPCSRSGQQPMSTVACWSDVVNVAYNRRRARNRPVCRNEGFRPRASLPG
jgi:hypothetical protein